MSSNGKEHTEEDKVGLEYFFPRVYVQEARSLKVTSAGTLGIERGLPGDVSVPATMPLPVTLLRRRSGKGGAWTVKEERWPPGAR